VAAAGIGAAAAVFRGPALQKGLVFGVVSAWVVSSASVGWLLWARNRSIEAFWRAFGGGMAVRAAALAGLMFWSWGRADVSVEALLLSYVFGVLTMLLTMETRYLKL
jgi:hypothetical protein